MKGIDELTKEDAITAEEIVDYKIVKNPQVAIIENFINNYIEDGVHICRHCGAQIRFAHKRIVKWVEKNKSIIEKVKNANICQCGATLPDKRYKFCKDCK